jgi:hypothetical protein
VELRGEGKGVHIDTSGRAIGVVLVGLHLVEVATLTDLEAIVAVKLEESSDDRVLAGHTLDGGVRETAELDGAIPEVRVVEGLLTIPILYNIGVARYERIALDNPDKLLDGVVEVELDLVGRGSDGLAAGELENLNEVLVGHLGELAALISVKEDVVNIERGSRETSSGNAVNNLLLVGPAEVAEIVELEVDAHLVVLEGDQRESKTRVAAEPELEGDIESVLGGALGDDVGLVGALGGINTAILVTISSSIGIDQVGELGHVTNHLGINGLLTGLLGELIPDMEPITVMFIAKC